MTIEIMGLRTCDTCRKALRALPGAVLRDVREAPLSRDEIAALLALFGDPLVNRASTTWRGLSPEQLALDPADLLAAHPALMKRPVIRTAEGCHLGWSEPVRTALGVG